MDKNTNHTSELKLTELNMFTKKDIDLFEQYCIAELGQLLGITSGLTNVEIFDSIENSDSIISELKLLVGEKELKKYSDFEINYPDGLIIDENE